MSMYPSVGGALINAFNSTLFDSYKSAGWQRLASALNDKYPDLDMAVSEYRNSNNEKLSKVDWATQAGMTAGLLRNHLKPADYHVLKMRYTHDGNRVIAGNCELRLNMSDNARSALIEGWPLVRQELIRQRLIRASVLTNENRLQYMALRAIRSDLVEIPYQAKDEDKQVTINNQQSEVKRALSALFKTAMERAENVLREGDLIEEVA